MQLINSGFHSDTNRHEAGFRLCRIYKMNPKNVKLVPKTSKRNEGKPDKLSYWRSAYNCFSIDYKGSTTDICKDDLGYGDMDRLDGVIHAAIECKRKDIEKCKLKKGQS